MLERTAGCLESGSLRRLLPASRKTLKSRRTLHSSFWSHGASDLELSPLWTALVRAADAVDQGQKTSTGNTGMLLDFLYPTGTVNFLRQYSGLGIERQDGKWCRIGLGKFGQRQYTSSAKDTSDADPSTELQSTGENRTQHVENGSMELLYRLLSLSKSYDYEEAWRQFLLLEGDKQGRLRKELIQYFSTSDRIVDAERTTELFRMLSQEQKTPTVYRSTIRSYLILRNLAEAMKLHKTALESLEIPAGSEELLAYLVKNSFWSRAVSVWKDVHDFRERFPMTSYNIFEVLDTYTTLGSQAIELAEYVNKRIENASSDPPEDADRLKYFASRVIRRALLSVQAFTPSRFTALLKTLQNWSLATPSVYDGAIQMLLQLNETKLAVKCYQQARQGSEVKFTRSTLHTVLKIFCDNQSIIGMQQVLDDFFKLYSKPSRFAYNMCMTAFAAQGDARTVHALFDQYTNRFTQHGRRPVLNADDMAPVLHVHAKRGELQEVINLFDQIKGVYGLEPTLLCWNILINAYGKVHDIDGAYDCFEKLLNSQKIRPDDYTFGTMMGICTSRGDLDRVVELYMFAEELKVEKTTAMVDCLVLAHIQDGQIEKAEKICEDAIGMELSGSRTRMWNYILIAYAMRRDLVNVNRLLQRMSQVDIESDQYTYSALMQALAMVKQPDRAYAILQEVMPEAGIKATSFHYAIVMGGYLANGEISKMFHVQNRMARRNIRNSATSNLLALKAMVAEDERLLQEGADQQLLTRALQMFHDVISTIDLEDIAVTPRKGTGHMPLDIAYSSMLYSYIIFVLGQRSEFATVNKLYEDFMLLLPEPRSGKPPLRILSAMMASKFKEKDHDAIQQCWDLALSQAKQDGSPITMPRPLASKSTVGDAHRGPKDHDSATHKPHSISKNLELREAARTVLPAHQLNLSTHLTFYLRSLFAQQRTEDMILVVNNLLRDGFVLDCHNWNLYVQLLAHRYKYKLAFEVCESRLMDGWTGWARLRWQLPERNRLPLELRNSRKQPTHLRPKYHTLLYLARGFIELQDLAAESRASQFLIEDLERDCPRTVMAIKTMQRVDDDLERDVLRGV